MPRRLPRKFHLTIDPPVQAELPAHRVTFDGLNFLRPHVMVEYRAEPPVDGGSPLDGRRPFDPKILTLHVVDDTSDEPYPTEWPDFNWNDLGPGRMTTRLEHRPPPDATQLFFTVFALDAAADPAAGERSPVASFVVELPRDHATPWPSEP
jgi:hypothetical protein